MLIRATEKNKAGKAHGVAGRGAPTTSPWAVFVVAAAFLRDDVE